MSVERVELVVVRAPEVRESAGLSGIDLQVEPVRRMARPGASIMTGAFNLRDVGHVPGCESEYIEESQAFGPDEEDISSDSMCVSSVDKDLNRRSLDDDDPEPDGLDPTIAIGIPSEEDDEDEEAAEAAVNANEEKVMENLVAVIGKAVHLSMLKSIRNTAVLSQTSKKKTMLNMNRLRNSFLDLNETDAAEDEQDEDLRELLNFQI